MHALHHHAWAASHQLPQPTQEITDFQRRTREPGGSDRTHGRTHVSYTGSTRTMELKHVNGAEPLKSWRTGRVAVKRLTCWCLWGRCKLVLTHRRLSACSRLLRTLKDPSWSPTGGKNTILAEDVKQKQGFRKNIFNIIKRWENWMWSKFWKCMKSHLFFILVHAVIPLCGQIHLWSQNVCPLLY